MNESPTPEDLGFQLPEPAKVSRTGVVVAIVVVVGATLAFGLWRHHGAALATTVPAAEQTAPRVEVIHPKILTSASALALPGTVRALEETQIYARASGYVRTWNVDIGDQVAAGKLLAELDTPELDAQLAQARAQLAQAKAAVAQAVAQRDYSKSNSARTESLVNQQLVSKSTSEQASAQAATDQATVAAAQSNVAAQEANVRRLVDTQRFAKVTAPFAGTITTRSVDRGALVRDGATTPMFTLVATDPIRIFVDVPQSVTAQIVNGQKAVISTREFGPRTFEGKVTRSSGSLDPNLHTMVTEIQVPNPDGKLLPGMYVTASIDLPVPHAVVEIPATALYSDALGLRIALVDRAGTVKFQKIVIERDTGAALQIASELTGDEQIIKTAVPSLVDGDHVDIMVADKKP